MFIINKSHIHRPCSLFNYIYDFLFAENSFSLKLLNLYIREFLYKIFFCHIGNANIFEFIVLIMFDYVTQSNYFLFG